MCNLDEHHKYSTRNMYTKLVEKYEGRLEYNFAKGCEHTQLYKNVGKWRKDELARAYPSLYGKGGWANLKNDTKTIKRKTNKQKNK